MHLCIHSKEQPKYAALEGSRLPGEEILRTDKLQKRSSAASDNPVSRLPAVQPCSEPVDNKSRSEENSSRCYTVLKYVAQNVHLYFSVQKKSMSSVHSKLQTLLLLHTVIGD